MGISEFAATSASMGSSLRQGGHQVAHRFTTEGRPAKFSGIRVAPLRRDSCGKSGSGRGSGGSSAVAVNQTAPKIITVARSEERRVGKECVSTGRYRWSPYTYKKKCT